MELVFSVLKFEDLSENLTKLENIVIHWSVATSNEEKTEGRKYRWAVHFRNSLMLNGQGYGIDPRFYDSKPLWPLIHMLYF